MVVPPVRQLEIPDKITYSLCSVVQEGCEMPITLCFVKQFERSPRKPLNWKQNMVASPLLPEKEMKTLGRSQELLLLLPIFPAHPAL